MSNTMKHSVKASTCFVAFLVAGMDLAFCHAAEPSRLTTLSRPTDKQLAGLEPSRIEFLMLIPYPGKTDRPGASSANLAQFLSKASSLKSLWISPEYLSDDILKVLRAHESIKLLVVTDPLDGQDLIDKIATSKSIDRLILLIDDDALKRLAGKHGQRLIVEVESQRGNQYLDANGCPTSVFLEEHFGVKF